MSKAQSVTVSPLPILITCGETLSNAHTHSPIILSQVGDVVVTATDEVTDGLLLLSCSSSTLHYQSLCDTLSHTVRMSRSSSEMEEEREVDLVQQPLGAGSRNCREAPISSLNKGWGKYTRITPGE